MTGSPLVGMERNPPLEARPNEEFSETPGLPDTMPVCLKPPRLRLD